VKRGSAFLDGAPQVLLSSLSSIDFLYLSRPEIQILCTMITARLYREMRLNFLEGHELYLTLALYLMYCLAVASTPTLVVETGRLDLECRPLFGCTISRHFSRHWQLSFGRKLMYKSLVNPKLSMMRCMGVSAQCRSLAKWDTGAL
jgi:hypothetical protein